MKKLITVIIMLFMLAMVMAQPADSTGGYEFQDRLQNITLNKSGQGNIFVEFEFYSTTVGIWEKTRLSLIPVGSYCPGDWDEVLVFDLVTVGAHQHGGTGWERFRSNFIPISQVPHGRYFMTFEVELRNSNTGYIYPGYDVMRIASFSNTGFELTECDFGYSFQPPIFTDNFDSILLSVNLPAFADFSGAEIKDIIIQSGVYDDNFSGASVYRSVFDSLEIAANAVDTNWNDMTLDLTWTSYTTPGCYEHQWKIVNFTSDDSMYFFFPRFVSLVDGQLCPIFTWGYYFPGKTNDGDVAEYEEAETPVMRTALGDDTVDDYIIVRKSVVKSAGVPIVLDTIYDGMKYAILDEGIVVDEGTFSLADSISTAVPAGNLNVIIYFTQ